MSSTSRSSVVCFGSREVVVEIVRRTGAQRMTLRNDMVRGLVRVTLPPQGRISDAEKFVVAHSAWITARVAEWPDPLPFEPGSTFPFDGASLTIEWRVDHPRGVRRSGDRLMIGGPKETVQGRTLRWLGAAALSAVSTQTHDLAGQIARRVTKVAVRDPAGRWGSCSSSGAISYSWRLILAPPLVRQSVVAHEVAHLVHPNHGRDFWRLATSLTTGDLAAARLWLKVNGAALHWVGRAV